MTRIFKSIWETELTTADRADYGDDIKRIISDNDTRIEMTVAGHDTKTKQEFFFPMRGFFSLSS